MTPQIRLKKFQLCSDITAVMASPRMPDGMTSPVLVEHKTGQSIEIMQLGQLLLSGRCCHTVHGSFLRAE